MKKNKILQMVTANYKFFKFMSQLYNRLQIKNKWNSKGLKLSAGVSIINGLKIVNHGVDNEVQIGDFVRIKGCTIIIYGNQNQISIGHFAELIQVEMYIEDDKNEIVIGQHTSLCGRTHLAAIEGTRILIGEHCLFSSDLHFRTGDSHSILDMNGKRINESKDIIIKDHVWIGTKVTCLKGVYVAEDSIVAATTTLCKRYEEQNTIIAGIPGEVIKRGVNWKNQRIPMEN